MIVVDLRAFSDRRSLTEPLQVHLEMPHGHTSPAAEGNQSTTDMFLDMFTKKGKFLSKLTSFDSEVKKAASSIRTMFKLSVTEDREGSEKSTNPELQKFVIT